MKSKFKGRMQFKPESRLRKRVRAPDIEWIPFGDVMRQAAMRRRARKAAGSDASPERL